MQFLQLPRNTNYAPHHAANWGTEQLVKSTGGVGFRCHYPPARSPRRRVFRKEFSRVIRLSFLARPCNNYQLSGF